MSMLADIDNALRICGNGDDVVPAPPDPVTLDKSAPLTIARMFLATRFAHPHGRTLQHALDLMYRFDGTAYREIPAQALRLMLYEYMEAARCVNSEGVATPFNPSKRVVDAVLDALKAIAFTSALAPAWLSDDPNLPDARRLMVARNGIFDLADTTGRAFRKPTPMLFTTSALDFDFQPDAPKPREWFRFLETLWANDVESLMVLRAFMGYTLTADTSQQKALLIVGPPRSGKGTIARIWARLLGIENVCGPTLSSLGTNFGLWPLIGRRLAIVSDARLSGRTDQAVITERLLTITGEDALTIDRKNLPPLTVQLPTRFVILTNELPRLNDSSGALANRFIILRLKESHLGREDTGLTDRLLGELPGILNWAVDGWRDLQAAGRFIQPTAGQQAIDELMDLASPVGAFVRDWCEVGPAKQVPVADIFAAWGAWCKEQGRNEPGIVQVFSRDLRAAVPGIDVSQPREGGGRIRCFDGIALTPSAKAAAEHYKATGGGRGRQ